MGVYTNSKDEILEALSTTLDDLEGDFTKDTLCKALEELKQYAPCSDTSKKAEILWHKKMSEIYQK